MNEREVLNLILEQIGNLRIPMKEEALRQQIYVVQRNVEALLFAFEQNKAKEDAAQSESEEEKTDV